MPSQNLKYFFAVAIVGILIAIAAILANDQVLARNIDGWVSDSSAPSPTSIRNSSLASNSSPANTAVKVAEVIDGDTVLLENGIRVRYLYLDTPETKKPNTPVQCFGPESSEYNKRLTEGKLVRLVQDKDSKDKYGRDLRIVFLEGKNTANFDQSVNAELIKLGFAKSSFYSPNTKYKAEVQRMEAEAKQKKLGIWQACESQK